MNQEQYDFIQKKYGNLIYSIAHHISGDNATADIEDNVQDLWLSVCDAIRWFEQQNHGANGSFETFKNTKGFDQYIKTCLWHKKAKKGTSITKKQVITRAISIDGDSNNDNDPHLMDVCDPKASNINLHDEVLEDIRIKMTPDEKQIIQHILNNPDCMKDNGTVNISQIAKAVRRNPMEVKDDVEYIKKRYNFTLL
jgi:hypothetical protein